MKRWIVLCVIAACGGPQATGPDGVPPDVPPAPTTAPVLLVANKADATVTVLELPGGRALATLPTGPGPHEIAVSPDGRRAVVTSYGDQATMGRALAVIDLPSLSVERAIDLGAYRRPHGIAFLDATRVVVTAEVNASVVIVDVAAGRVEEGIFTSQQGSHMLALSPDARTAYVASIGSGTVTPIDLAARTAGEPVAAVPASEGIGVAAGGAEVWTASLKEDVIVSLDGRTLAEVARLPAEGAPIRLTPTPDGRTMLVSNVNGSSLQVIDVATRAVERVAFTPLAGPTAAPVGTVVATDGATAYVALVAEDRIAVVDLATRAVTGYLTAGRGPDGLGYSTVFVR